MRRGNEFGTKKRKITKKFGSGTELGASSSASTPEQSERIFRLPPPFIHLPEKPSSSYSLTLPVSSYLPDYPSNTISERNIGDDISSIDPDEIAAIHDIPEPRPPEELIVSPAPPTEDEEAELEKFLQRVDENYKTNHRGGRLEPYVRFVNFDNLPIEQSLQPTARNIHKADKKSKPGDMFSSICYHADTQTYLHYHEIHQESVPNGIIQFRGYQFNNEGPDGTVTLMNIHDWYKQSSKEQLMKKLWREIAFMANNTTQYKDQNFYWSFSVEGRRIETVPDAIPFMKIVSPLYKSKVQFLLEEEIEDTWLAWLDEWISTTGETDYERFWIDSLHLYHIPEMRILFFTEDWAAGCDIDKSTKPPTSLLPFFNIFPSIKENLCFFTCIWDQQQDFVKTKFQIDDIGKSLYQCLVELKEKIWGPHNPKDPKNFIHFNDIIKIVNTLGLTIKIYSVKLESNINHGWKRSIHIKNGNQFEPLINDNSNLAINIFHRVVGKKGHFYSIKEDKLLEFIQYKSCNQCGMWKTTEGVDKNQQLRFDHPKYCKKDNRIDKRIGRIKKFKKVKKPSETKCRSYDKNIIIADFETFTNENLLHQVYCVSFALLDDLKKYQTEELDINKVKVLYGKNSLNQFMDILLGLPKKKKYTIVFYNGARFDYLFIINWLVEHQDFAQKFEWTFQKEEKSTTMSIFRLSKRHIFFDLFKFTTCALKTACKAFGVPKKYEKEEFDHRLITSWEKTKEYEKEVTHYVRFDIISTGILYYIIGKMFYHDFDVNFNDFISLSSTGFHIFLSKLPLEIRDSLKVPQGEHYNRIRKTIYGGRCSPFMPYYFSNFYQTTFQNWNYLEEEEKELELLKLSGSLEVLKLVDYTSLYPGACVKYPQLYGTFQYYGPEDNLQKIIDMMTAFEKLQDGDNVLESTVDRIQRSIFCVDVKCPKDLLIPFLLSKDKKGKMECNLFKKIKQSYSGDYLLYALQLGYKITFVHYYYLFGKREYICKDYIEDIMKRKDAAPPDSAQREMNKLLANGFYGKTVELAHIYEGFLIANDEYFTNNTRLDKIKSIDSFFVNSKLKCLYVQSEKDLEDPRSNVYTKPLQIGVKILEDSKREMYDLWKNLNCIRDVRNQIYYTDTDSTVTTRECILKVKDQSIFGDKFTKFKDEFPTFYIIAGLFPAKKTYFLLMLHKKTGHTHMYYRSKGCPSNKNNKGADKTYNLTELAYIPLNERDTSKFDPWYYLLDENNNIIGESFYIKWEWAVKVYYEKDGSKILTSFGRLEKKFNDVTAASSAMRVKTNNDVSRLLGKKDWWGDMEERVHVHVGDWNLAVPIGHESLPENFRFMEKNMLDVHIIQYFENGLNQ